MIDSSSRFAGRLWQQWLPGGGTGAPRIGAVYTGEVPDQQVFG